MGGKRLGGNVNNLLKRVFTKLCGGWEILTGGGIAID